MTTISKSHIKVADEVWIATALLHRENPKQPDFAVEEIVKRATKEAIEPIRPGVYVHVIQHCVANRPPTRAATACYSRQTGRRRLFRKGHSYHPAREGAKVTPSLEELPQGYEDLLGWYSDWSSAALHAAAETDPLLSLAGSGKKLWSDEHADEYVNRLREGWE